ncbi:MAG: hypothetical protein CM15mV102_010 [uncultured marine virus]|nr:MAG: hypothetical protein CM15mV102_010 [uncultured marine virus]
MNDPRYDRDPAFGQDVIENLTDLIWGSNFARAKTKKKEKLTAKERLALLKRKRENNQKKGGMA